MTLSHILSVIVSTIAVARKRALVKRSLGPILLREDDHLLRDIGLTRHDVAELIRNPDPSDTRFTLEAQQYGATLCRVV
ncbi:MAG: hypothetical protein V4712_12060 [Pseudomonadota bacterium]